MSGVFRHQHRITYSDCTVGNHVYYSRYLDLLEEARGEFFRSLGVTLLQWQEREVIFPVIEARLSYRSPARYDDVLAIAVCVKNAERARLTFTYEIENQARVTILEAETAHVCTGLNDKPKRLPEELAVALQPFIHATQEA